MRDDDGYCGNHGIEGAARLREEGREEGVKTDDSKAMVKSESQVVWVIGGPVGSWAKENNLCVFL